MNSRTKRTACTKPRAHTRLINCNTIPQKDITIPYIAQPRYRSGDIQATYKFFFYKIFFLFQTIRATSHYQEFTDRHSPQYFNLSFPLHFITDKFFDFPSRTSASLLKSRPKTMHAAIPDPTNKIKWPNFPSLSTDLGHSGDQRILYLGRFLV